METKRKKIKTIVRVRPLLHEEVAEDPRARSSAIKLHPNGKKIALSKDSADRDFEFDGIAYYKNTTQESFYAQHCVSAITELFNGFNTSFIVYGTVRHIYEYDP